MSYESITVDETDGQATVALDRPDVTNAMDPQMFAELNDAFRTFHDEADNGQLDVVTVYGAGNHFSAGADLQAVPEWEDTPPREIWADFQLFHETFGLIEDLPVPVLAAVEGYCLAAGLELAISCDFIVAKDDATFALPESGKGLVMDFGGAQKLPGMIGEQNAMYLILTSESIDAERAQSWGLVQELVEGDEAFAARMTDLEEKLASFPTYALGFNKDEVLSTRPATIDEAKKVAIAYAISVAKEEETQRLVEEFLDN